MWGARLPTSHDQSVIHGLDPRSKIAWLCVVIGVSFYLAAWGSYTTGKATITIAALLAFVLVYGLLSKSLGALKQLVWILPGSSAVLILTYIVGKNASYSLSLAYTFTSVITFFLSGFLFTLTTPAQDLAKVFEKGRAPRVISFPLTVALSSVSVVDMEFKDILDAAAMRGLSLRITRNLRRDLNTLQRILIPFVVSLVRITDEKADAAESRGFSCPYKRTSLRPLKFHKNDYIFLLCNIAFFVSVLSVNRGLVGAL
jgi:energy-coupling factor transport system permease protein